MADNQYRGGPWAIKGKVSKITPERIMAALERLIPLRELIGSDTYSAG